MGVDDQHIEDRLVMFCEKSNMIPGNTETLRKYLRAWKERLGGWGNVEDALWCIPSGWTVLEIQNKLCPMVREQPKTPAPPRAPRLELGPKIPLDMEKMRSKYPLPWQRPEIASGSAGGVL
jgi:hypothetical protein